MRPRPPSIERDHPIRVPPCRLSSSHQTAGTSVNLLTGLRAAGDPLPKLQTDPFAGPLRRISEGGVTRASQLRRVLLRTDVVVLLVALAIVELLRRDGLGRLDPGRAVAGLCGQSASPLGWRWPTRAASTTRGAPRRARRGRGGRPDHPRHDAVGVEHAPGGRLMRGAVNWLEQLAFLWAVVCVLSIAGRAAARAYGRRQVWYLQNALVLGTSAQAASIVRKIMRHPESGVNVVAVVDVDRTGARVERSEEFAFVPVLSGDANLQRAGRAARDRPRDHRLVELRGRPQRPAPHACGRPASRST